MTLYTMKLFLKYNKHNVTAVVVFTFSHLFISQRVSVLKAGNQLEVRCSRELCIRFVFILHLMRWQRK